MTKVRSKIARLFAIAVAVGLMLSLAIFQPVHGQGATTIVLSSLALSANASGQVSAQIQCGAPSCNTFAIELAFDPAVIRVDALTLADFLTQTGNLSIVVDNRVDNTAGTLSLAAVTRNGGFPPSTGAGTLFTIQVTALSPGGTRFEIRSLAVGTMASEVVPASAFSGRIEVSEAAPIVTETPAPPYVQIVREVVLRDGPGSQFASVAQVSPDQRFNIVGLSEDGGWYQIQLPSGQLGWITSSGTMASAHGDLFSIPIVSGNTVSNVTVTPPAAPPEGQTPVSTSAPAAAALSYGQIVDAAFDPASGNRWAFASRSGDTAVIEAQSETFTPVLHLYSADGELLAQSGNTPDIISTLPRTAVYFIEVSGGAIGQNYQLSLRNAPSIDGSTPRNVMRSLAQMGAIDDVSGEQVATAAQWTIAAESDDLRREYANFVLGVSLQWDENEATTTCGLDFRQQSDGSGYTVEFDASGHVRFSRHQNGAVDFEQFGTRSAIQIGPRALNDLVLVVNGQTISVYANQQFIGTFVDNLFSSGTIQFSASTSGEDGRLRCGFGDLWLWDINPVTRVRATTAANVRNGDGTNYAAIDVLLAGATARVIGVSRSGWYQIELTNGRTGWVSPVVVILEGNLSNVPAASVNSQGQTSSQPSAPAAATVPPSSGTSPDATAQPDSGGSQPVPSAAAESVPAQTATPGSATLPDVVITGVSFDRAIKVGETFTLYVSSANIGSAPADGYMVSCSFSPQGGGSETLTDYQQVGQSGTFSMRVTLSSGAGETSTVSCTADSGGWREELNEGNNGFSMSVTIAP